MAIKKNITTTYEGDIDPKTDITWKIEQVPISIMIWPTEHIEAGQAVPIDSSGNPIVDTHCFSTISKQELVAQIKIDDSNVLEYREALTEESLTLVESKEDIALRLAHALGIKYGLTVLGEVADEKIAAIKVETVE